MLIHNIFVAKTRHPCHSDAAGVVSSWLATGQYLAIYWRTLGKLWQHTGFRTASAVTL